MTDDAPECGGNFDLFYERCLGRRTVNVSTAVGVEGVMHHRHENRPDHKGQEEEPC